MHACRNAAFIRAACSRTPPNKTGRICTPHCHQTILSPLAHACTLPINLSLAGEALDVASGQDEYLTKMTTPASDEAKALGDATSVAPWAELHASGQTMFRFSNAWTTDAVEAKTLAMFAYMLRAKKVMEIGMFTGYGALTIAEVLPPDGKMVSCELDPFLATFSKPFFDKSPHGHKIEVRLGPALETMKGYDASKEGGGFDMIFIDADKGGYAGYYEAALDARPPRRRRRPRRRQHPLQGPGVAAAPVGRPRLPLVE